MSKFQVLLDACSEHLNGSKADFSLVSMAKNSPVELVLAPKSASPAVDRVMQFINETVRDVNQGLKPKCPQRLLRSFLVGTRFSIGYGAIQAETSELFESNLRGLLRRERREFQTVRGTIEAIDIHDKLEFRIFPKLGKPVRCRFEEFQFGQVQKAIGKIAEVTGVALVFKGDTEPTVLKVEALKVLESIPAPPKTLRGLGARDYAGIDSVAHVRSVRAELERGLGGG